MILAVFSCDKMDEQIQDIIAKYEEHVRSMENVPRCSYSRRMLQSDGGPNRSFFFYLFTDKAMAIEFPASENDAV